MNKQKTDHSSTGNVAQAVSRDGLQRAASSVLRSDNSTLSPDEGVCEPPSRGTSSCNAANIRLFGTVADSIVDGPGLRYAVFVQGCPHHCSGCHNPESQPFEGGTERDIAEIVTEVRENGLIRGVTLSGGEPFEQPEACAELARRLKSLGYSIWTYTGYLYEDLERMANAADARKNEGASAAESCTASGYVPSEIPGASGALGASSASSAFGALSAADALPVSVASAIRRLLDNTDVLVDGPFIESKKSLGLKYCGSSNQRLIDMAATKRAGCVVEWQQPDAFPTKPASW